MCFPYRKLKRQVFICKIKAALKAQSEDKQKSEEFLETDLGGGWEAAGFARCSLSTEKQVWHHRGLR